MVFFRLLMEAYQRKSNMRKSKSDVIRKKMELAKREPVDKFAKIAAPSGLLNGLNPGIINHVRNKKTCPLQYGILFEKLENGKLGSKQASHLKTFFRCLNLCFD